jgi:hypothetical protein
MQSWFFLPPPKENLLLLEGPGSPKAIKYRDGAAL